MEWYILIFLEILQLVLLHFFLLLHILENPIGPLALTGLDAKRVGAVRRLADGSEVLRGESWITNAYENLAFVTLGTIPHFTYLLPNPADTVLEIEYKEACL